MSMIKLVVIAIFFAGALGVVSMRPANVVNATAAAADPAETYKAKCSMCHTPTASKFFDPARPEEEMVQSVLKGRKAEKPPNMPAFEEKGVTADVAKELIAYMKTLKGAPK